MLDRRRAQDSSLHPSVVRPPGYLQDRQANAKATDFRSSWIDGGPEDGQEQEKCQDRFNQDTCAEGDTRAEVRRTELGRLPDRLRKNGAEQESGQGCANELGHDIQYPQNGCNTPRYKKSDGDGGVDMSSPSRTEGGDHDRECQSMCKSDTSQAQAATQK